MLKEIFILLGVGMNNNIHEGINDHFQQQLPINAQNIDNKAQENINEAQDERAQAQENRDKIANKIAENGIQPPAISDAIYENEFFDMFNDIQENNEPSPSPSIDLSIKVRVEEGTHSFLNEFEPEYVLREDAKRGEIRAEKVTPTSIEKGLKPDSHTVLVNKNGQLVGSKENTDKFIKLMKDPHTKLVGDSSFKTVINHWKTHGIEIYRFKNEEWLNFCKEFLKRLQETNQNKESPQTQTLESTPNPKLERGKKEDKVDEAPLESRHKANNQSKQDDVDLQEKAIKGRLRRSSEMLQLEMKNLLASLIFLRQVKDNLVKYDNDNKDRDHKEVERDFYKEKRSEVVIINEKKSETQKNVDLLNRDNYV